MVLHGRVLQAPLDVEHAGAEPELKQAPVEGCADGIDFCRGKAAVPHQNRLGEVGSESGVSDPPMTSSPLHGELSVTSRKVTSPSQSAKFTSSSCPSTYASIRMPCPASPLS
jgi:hypothetical protein